MSEVINKHSRMPRHGESSPVYSTRELKSKKVPVEQRQAIVDDAKALILQHWTIDEIAQKHGIAPRTLDYWFSDLGEEYQQLRSSWLNSMLTEAGDMLKRAQNPTAIAQARELWKRATWYAERLDRKRYGQDQPQVHVHLVDLGERLRRARERVIDAEVGADKLRLAHAHEATPGAP